MEVPLPPGFERDVQNRINEVIALNGVAAELHAKVATAHVVRGGHCGRTRPGIRRRRAMPRNHDDTAMVAYRGQ